MATVSKEYLEGIKEGRAAVKLLDPASIADFAQSEINFCKNVAFWSGSAIHADFIKGQRDFWENQLKKSKA